MNPNDTVALRARLVFPVSSPPIWDGVVVLNGGRVLEVGPYQPGRETRDLGNVALLPGLINAHVHLEFSDLIEPLGTPGTPFTDWIRLVVSRRRESPLDAHAAIRTGLDESARRGVACVGEIATIDWPDIDTPIEVTAFRELIGLSVDRIEDRMSVAREHVSRGKSSAANWRPGLSPHAPYSVNPQLLERVCRLSAAERIPVAMHVAETLEEVELLNSASGPFVELLSDLDAWDPGAIPRGVQPGDYLRQLSHAWRALVIHGNYLTKPDFQFLADQADRMSVVYCPRTHAWFGHANYPLSAMLKAGVNVAAGTDSRASNPDLNLFEELRFVAQRHADVDPADVLRMGTLNAAKALGVADRLGSLDPGKQAALSVVELADAERADPYESLFDAAQPVVSTYPC